jgi:alpha-ketoglutarate-dependent taurine dioxygenase
MQLAPGDIQWLSNHTILHARTAYEDHRSPERKRHLLRLWLSTEKRI